MAIQVFKSKALTLFLIVAITFLSACTTSSKDEEPTTTSDSVPRTVNNEEAQLLSRVLYENHLAKNASFVARSGDLSTEGFIAQGKVDWESKTVSMQVSLADPSIVDLTSVSTEVNVLENYLGLDPAIPWVRRSLDPQTFGIDALSLFVIKLASESADNPLLIRQDGAQFLGVETTSGVDTLMLKSPGGITFYVTVEGELKKVKAQIKGFANDVSFLLSAFSQTQIEVPSDEDIVELDDVRTFYLANRPKF